MSTKIKLVKVPDGPDTCPNCYAELDASAVACPECGYCLVDAVCTGLDAVRCDDPQCPVHGVHAVHSNWRV